VQKAVNTVFFVWRDLVFGAKFMIK
jgi:hypothetical protein